MVKHGRDYVTLMVSYYFFSFRLAEQTSIAILSYVLAASVKWLHNQRYAMLGMLVT